MTGRRVGDATTQPRRGDSDLPGVQTPGRDRMKEVESGGVKIRYEDLGQGEPALLLMPAWCMSRAGFATLPEKLAARRRVLSLDWRGHGQSDPPRGDFGWQALVEDAQAVMEVS